MFKRLFIDHPKTVDESYLEHFRFAAKFGLRMIWGGMGAVVHAIIPGLCKSTGSSTIRKLNDSVVEQREAKRKANGEMHSIEYII
ncbi:DUF6356 family protein [Sphingorhabdus arenilitoris]|uniref:DUF6356 family protein n=1 Tax=Sphingorhabdus arenilitoris TaxID=1490041 RepID=A0ABV8RLB2_9SPHN